jgi:hypothetical protein
VSQPKRPRPKFEGSIDLWDVGFIMVSFIPRFAVLLAATRFCFPRTHVSQKKDK